MMSTPIDSTGGILEETDISLIVSLIFLLTSQFRLSLLNGPRGTCTYLVSLEDCIFLGKAPRVGGGLH